MNTPCVQYMDVFSAVNIILKELVEKIEAGQKWNVYRIVAHVVLMI